MMSDTSAFMWCSYCCYSETLDYLDFCTRSPAPAKRMCITTLPDRRERAPLGVLSENNFLPIFQSGAARNSPATCFDFKGTSSGEPFSDGSSKTQMSSSSPALDVSSKKCLRRENDFRYVLPGDICEDFHEETLKELDDICKKQ